jgi:hypothetical protein
MRLAEQVKLLSDGVPVLVEVEVAVPRLTPAMW